MTVLPELEPYAWASVAFFGLAAVLILYVLMQPPSRTTRRVAWMAIASVTAANAALIMTYAGEPAVAYETPGPMPAKAAGGRGYFTFEKNAEDGAAGKDDGTSTVLASTVGPANGLDAQAGGQSPATAPGQNVQGFSDCSDCPEMVAIQPGSVRIEAVPEPRYLTLRHVFAIGRFEVTVAQYEAFARATGRVIAVCEGQDGTAVDAKLPMTCVSAIDAMAYVDWLTGRTGLSYRLPSEAEWEFAARGGEGAAFVTGKLLMPGEANFGRGGVRMLPVGSYEPNRFGLYDVHGNAAELVAGCWQDTISEAKQFAKPTVLGTGCLQQILRNGHAGESVERVRLDTRRPVTPDARALGIGFRVARDLP
ncbi:MAG: SUMF1/EgtB/PvdO family nonheme iron enzyme [Hyphomicrobiaceae bacterium]